MKTIDKVVFSVLLSAIATSAQYIPIPRDDYDETGE